MHLFLECELFLKYALIHREIRFKHEQWSVCTLISHLVVQLRDLNESLPHILNFLMVRLVSFAEKMYLLRHFLRCIQSIIYSFACIFWIFHVFPKCIRNSMKTKMLCTLLQFAHSQCNSLSANRTVQPLDHHRTLILRLLDRYSVKHSNS